MSKDRTSFSKIWYNKKSYCVLCNKQRECYYPWYLPRWLIPSGICEGCSNAECQTCYQVECVNGMMRCPKCQGADCGWVCSTCFNKMTIPCYCASCHFHTN